MSETSVRPGPANALLRAARLPTREALQAAFRPALRPVRSAHGTRGWPARSVPAGREGARPSGRARTSLRTSPGRSSPKGARAPRGYGLSLRSRGFVKTISRREQYPRNDGFDNGPPLGAGRPGDPESRGLRTDPARDGGLPSALVRFSLSGAREDRGPERGADRCDRG